MKLGVEFVPKISRRVCLDALSIVQHVTITYCTFCFQVLSIYLVQWMFCTFSTTAIHKIRVAQPFLSRTQVLVVMNILMQGVFVGIAWFNFLEPDVDAQTMRQDAFRWRRSSAHSLSDPVKRLANTKRLSWVFVVESQSDHGLENRSLVVHVG